jgi:hypothetical protein
MRQQLIFPMLALVASACLDFNSPDVDRTERPAYLEWEGYPENVVAPTSAQRGTAFNVTFSTYGDGCVERTDTEAVVSGLEVHIFATQVVRTNETCTSELNVASHVVPVTVILAGTAAIYVHGWRQPQNQELIVVRSVTVAP